MNIVKCPICNGTLIHEDVSTHECQINNKPKRFFGDTENDYYEIFDGVRWIPFKLSDCLSKGNTNKTTENGTESRFDF